MTSKSINILKSTTFIVVIVLVLFSITISSYKRMSQLSEKNEVLIKDTRHLIEDTPLIRDSIVNFGKELLGTPYVTASCSRDGFDCSGFVYFVYQHFKIKVPRSSIEFKDFGTEIPIENVKRGDILLFLSPTRNVIGHVGIVTNPKGIDSEFIHATSGREMKVIISSLNQRGYADRFVKAIDVL